MKLEELARTISTECAAVRVRKLNRAVSSIYDDELRPHGLKISQMHILVMVARCGSVTPQKIGEFLIMDKSTMSRSLELMTKNGWLDGTYSEAERLQQVALTKDGRKLLKAAGKAWARAQRRVEKLLGESNWASLFRAVETLDHPSR
ncbi:MAG: winged helix-turn-helix transcriptional regulator [Pyrinomonadaceae bacterium]|nr:winged helix-turn-helix transcriptional regulator [Pyrinomonadaceae bacterium]